MTSQELIKICMKDFDRAKKFGIKNINWLPFKQAWFKAYELGQQHPKNKTYVQMCKEAAEMASEKHEQYTVAGEYSVKWVQARDSFLNSLCLAEMMQHLKETK